MYSRFYLVYSLALTWLVCDLSWSCFCLSHCLGFCLLTVVVVNRPLTAILDSLHLLLVTTAFRLEQFIVRTCFHQLASTWISEADPGRWPSRGLHNQPPVWNTGTTGLELCVWQCVWVHYIRHSLPMDSTASNTKQQPGITRSDQAIVAPTAHHSHGSGSGSTCMDSRQMATHYLMWWHIPPQRLCWDCGHIGLRCSQADLSAIADNSREFPQCGYQRSHDLIPTWPTETHPHGGYIQPWGSISQTIGYVFMWLQ
jgi:hypothetical protein